MSSGKRRAMSFSSIGDPRSGLPLARQGMFSIGFCPVVLINTSLRSARDVRVPKSTRLTNTATERRVRGVFGPVRFFEAAAVGVEVAPAKFAVRVSALDANKAFAKAGLKEGDRVASLNG